MLYVSKLIRCVDGTSFGNTTNLSNDATISWAPVTAACRDNLFYITWTSWQGHEILYKRSINGGNTINLSNDPGKSAYARIAVSSNNNVNVLWVDNTPGNENVFRNPYVIHSTCECTTINKTTKSTA